MSFGKISEFDVKNGAWSSYADRLEMYFKVNSTEEELKLPTLISAMGDEAYELLVNLASPVKPSELTYQQAVELLRQHLQPSPSVLAERYRFRQRRQRPEENVSAYVAELKRLARNCKFNDKLNENLRDQFVCGLAGDIIRQRLFAEDENLNFANAVNIASSLEAAERDAAVVEARNVPEAAGSVGVHAMQTTSARTRRTHQQWSGGIVRPRPAASASLTPRHERGERDTRPVNCEGCGATGHHYGSCRFRNYVCSLCKQVGHLRRVCTAQAAGKSSAGRGGPALPVRGGTRGKLHYGQDATDYEEETEEDAIDLHQLCLRDYKPVSLPMSIDRKFIVMEVDTGTPISCISDVTYNKHFRDKPIQSHNLSLKFYDGSRIRPLGFITVSVEYENVVKTLELFVIEGGTTSLLGRQWLTELNITVGKLYNCNNIKSGSKTVFDVTDLLDRYKQLFDGSLGRFTGGKATLRVREGAAPVFHRARPLPYALRERVDAELDAMLRAGVIEPVDCSDWASPLVPVNKADGFHLSGVVRAPASIPPCSEPERLYRVTVSFDRCKITGVTCSCEARDIFWCQHVVALALYRIRNADSVRLRVPISETLLQMDRQQLQKFVQYLIAEHHTEVLPTAQRLADEVLQARSAINKICGAPDPTAGPPPDAHHAWHLDEQQVCEQVRAYLLQGTYYNANKQLNSLFSKVREMLRAQDSNGPRMLMLMTEQFLSDPRLLLWRNQNTPMTEKCRQLWEQLGALWVSIVLDPGSNKHHRMQWRHLLEKWSAVEVCPTEDPDYRSFPLYARERERSERDRDRDHRDRDRERHRDREERDRERLREREERDRERHRERQRREMNSHSESSDEESRPNNYEREYRRASKRLRLHNQRPAPQLTPRTVFHKALDAVDISWESEHLKGILSSDEYCDPDKPEKAGGSTTTPLQPYPKFNDLGQPLWHEHLPVVGARIEALRAHGRAPAALRLAVSAARAMRHRQEVAQQKWQEVGAGEASSSGGNTPCSGPDSCAGACADRIKLSLVCAHMDFGTCLSSGATCALSHTQRCIGRDSRCWTGWTLEAIWCVYECLADACLAPDDQRASPRLHTAYLDEEPNTGLPPRYQHVPVAASKNPEETYLALALEAALLGLGVQRILPSGLYAQERYCKQEERLIAQLQRVEGEAASAVCARVASALLGGGPASCLGARLPPRAAPAHTFARFLFLALLPTEPELAYKVGLRAMRLPMVEEAYALDGAAGGAGAGGAAGAWHTLQHAEQQQAALASALLGAARGNPGRLRAALGAAQRHVRSAAQLFRLAQDALRHAAPPGAPHHHRDLLAAAFELGLQVLRMTLSSVNWRRREMVRWLVTCATELGLDALLSIMQNWYELFTPTEATGPVAAAAMSHATALRLGLTFEQQEKLSACARTLALQCAAKDPPGCALSALSVCEGSAGAFEAACAAVGGAAARGALASSQLFAVARYMEQRGQPARAMRLATLAMRNLHLHYNQDSHPAIADIHWAVALAHSLGRAELQAMLPLLVKNVQCAPVLSDVLRRCCVAAAGCSRSRPAPPRPPTPLRPLLEAALRAYASTTHARLAHISPRHYADFVDFLGKARDTFALAHDGPHQFAALLQEIKLKYKGKKKLMFLVKERFG